MSQTRRLTPELVLRDLEVNPHSTAVDIALRHGFFRASGVRLLLEQLAKQGTAIAHGYGAVCTWCSATAPPPPTPDPFFDDLMRSNRSVVD